MLLLYKLSYRKQVYCIHLLLCFSNMPVSHIMIMLKYFCFMEGLENVNIRLYIGLDNLIFVNQAL